jgi:hypothetical protein
MAAAVAGGGREAGEGVPVTGQNVVRSGVAVESSPRVRKNWPFVG